MQAWIKLKRQTLSSLPFLLVLRNGRHCWVVGVVAGLVWLLPLGLGRRMRKSAIAPTTTQVMTIRRSGLQKACLFSGGGVGEEVMCGWMQDGKFVNFLWRGERVFFWGFLRKHGGWVWFFDGVIVVECVVNVVNKHHPIGCRKIRHFLLIYFRYFILWLVDSAVPSFCGRDCSAKRFCGGAAPPDGRRTPYSFLVVGPWNLGRRDCVLDFT
jgi:hypothetical protein